jgi:glycosyltransferase involved in cell wall biosynthesis
MDALDVSRKGRFAIIIPSYNHGQRIVDVIGKCLKLNIPIFVVDDGSTDSTRTQITGIKGVCPLHHNENRGKGAAILTGFAEASKIADWAITIDADGQHNPEDAVKMIQAIPENKRPIVVGIREGMGGKTVPWTSRFGRRFSNVWVWVSGGPRMTDSQSGFRIYPLPEAMTMKIIAKRFQFEVGSCKGRMEEGSVIETLISRIHAEKEYPLRPLIDFQKHDHICQTHRAKNSDTSLSTKAKLGPSSWIVPLLVNIGFAPYGILWFKISERRT